MRPFLALDYLANRRWMNAEFLGHAPLNSALVNQPSNRANVIFSQLGGVMAFAPRYCDASMTASIGMVGFRGIPPQIFDSVIGHIPIEVATLHTFWTPSNEGHQYNLMNTEIESLPIFTQHHIEIAPTPA